jgi:hypothetical protein
MGASYQNMMPTDWGVHDFRVGYSYTPAPAQFFQPQTFSGINTLYDNFGSDLSEMGAVSWITPGVMEQVVIPREPHYSLPGASSGYYPLPPKAGPSSSIFASAQLELPPDEDEEVVAPRKKRGRVPTPIGMNEANTAMPGGLLTPSHTASPVSTPRQKRFRTRSSSGAAISTARRVRDRTTARDRNSAAASRYREKKKAAEAQLVAAVSEARARCQSLRDQVNELHDQLFQVKSELLRHAGCDWPPIQQYLSHAAEIASAGPPTLALPLLQMGTDTFPNNNMGNG